MKFKDIYEPILSICQMTIILYVVIFNENVPHMLIEICTIRRGGLVEVGLILLEEMSH